MMQTSTELYVWPLDSWQSGYRDVFRRAKVADRELVHLTLQPVQAAPGSGRVLAFEHPPFICEYALIRTPASEFPESVASHLLKWYVGLADEPRVANYARWLTKTFVGQREVREIADEYADHGYEGERVFHAIH